MYQTWLTDLTHLICLALRLSRNNTSNFQTLCMFCKKKKKKIQKRHTQRQAEQQEDTFTSSACRKTTHLTVDPGNNLQKKTPGTSQIIDAWSHLTVKLKRQEEDYFTHSLDEAHSAVLHEGQLVNIHVCIGSCPSGDVAAVQSFFFTGSQYVHRPLLLAVAQ